MNNDRKKPYFIPHRRYLSLSQMLSGDVPPSLSNTLHNFSSLSKLSSPPITGYFTKTTMVDLTIEPEFDGPSVLEVCKQIFPHGFNFLLEDLAKTRMFYEFILVDSKTAEITHVSDKNDIKPRIIPNGLITS